jgi:hypothetical protein
VRRWISAATGSDDLPSTCFLIELSRSKVGSAPGVAVVIRRDPAWALRPRLDWAVR